MKKLLVFFVLFFLCSINSFTQLKLTCPNGGEKFVTGSDTLITWEGILPSDTVKLEYSIDNGLNWKLISDKALGLKYVWKNIPKPTSNECLVRIKPFSKVDSSNFEPDIEWQKTYGGSKDEYAYSAQQTNDGGYIVSGATWSNNGDITSDFGSQDYWVIKLDVDGNIVWKKTYGTKMDEFTPTIKQTNDGGYILAGTEEVDGGFTIWILKLDNSGNIDWDLKHIYKNYADNYMSSIKQTSDSGYIVSGSTAKYSRASEGLIFKLDKTGNVIWEKTFISNTFNGLSDIQQTNDGGYITAGSTGLEKLSSTDIMLVKVNSNGDLEWLKTYSQAVDNYDCASSVIQTKDGGFIIGATTKPLNKPNDFYLIKTDILGNMEWNKKYGGNSEDLLSSIKQTPDGGFIVVGSSNSKDGDIKANIGSFDGWIIKLTPSGELKWQKNIGGNLDDNLLCIEQTNDGGFITAGSTSSSDIPGCINKGKSDYYIVKIGTKIKTCQSDSVFSIIAPQALTYDIDMKKQLVGTPKDSLITDFLYNSGSCKFRVDSIYFRGADAGAFSLLSGFPKYTLASSKGKNTHLGFTPQRVGIHKAEIVIITQSDTLIRNIKGEGILPQIKVLNDTIDFGKVIVGKNKDTLQAVTITNTGPSAMKITKTKHNKPNDYDFSTLAGGGSFILNSGDTAKLDLRFKPSAIGKTNGTLEFYYEGIGSPAIINLYGEGLSNNPEIQAPESIDFKLICSSSMVNNIPIYNSGGDTLVISEMNIKGINANEFSVNEILPKKIAPFYTKTIAIEFKPNSLGTKSADLEIKSNSDPNILITIPITAKKDSMNLSFIENTIDLGLLCPGETKDTVIHIMNLGNINTGGHLTNSTNITLGKNEITILPSNTGNIAFQFNGLNAEGIINENITLTDSICGISKTITITGIIQTPKLESGGLVITCIQLTSNDGILTLENKSDRSVLIQNAPIITAPFSLVSNPFPLTIPAHGTKDITLRYSPTDYISHSSAIKFYAEPCDITYETTITGKVSIPTAEIKIDTLSAYPGDILYIPIILNSESNLDLAGESSFSSDLIFNPTLLTPQDQTLNQLQLVDYTHAKIQIKDIPLNSKIGEVLVKIPFVVGLGNAEDCELILQNGKTDNGKAGINSKNGLFKLLGICREGGTRLINPTGKAEISSIIPNPASDDIEININLIEEGNTTLSIYNTNGTKFNEFYISGKTGLRTIKLNAKEFSNGLYYIQLQTPTVVESKKLMIIK